NSLPRRIVEAHDSRLEQLTHNTERELALQLTPPRLQHLQAPLTPEPRCRGEQRALANSRRPLHTRITATATQGSLHRARQRLELRLPFKQRFKHAQLRLLRRHDRF